MRKFVFALSALSLLAASCEEFEPVVTFKYTEPDRPAFVGDDYAKAYFGVEKFTDISAIKSKYGGHGKPYTFDENIVIRGEVTTSDEAGNVYREIYLQDKSGAIDFKIGRSSSYDDYKVGQILYVNCNGMTIGEYGYKDGNYGGCGLLQLGMKRNQNIDPVTGEFKDFDDYETSYIDLQPILDAKVLKGAILPKEERVKPVTVPASDLTSDDFKKTISNAQVGKLIQFDGLKYANSVGGKEVFVLFYPNPNLNHSKNEGWNRVFVSSPTDRKSGVDYSYGIKWWALTKNRFIKMVESGAWDDLQVGSGGDLLGPIASTQTNPDNFGVGCLYKTMILDHPSAQNVSQYFLMADGKTEVQIRTSGYSRFADIEIPEDIRSGSAGLSCIGILTRYQGGAQLTLLEAWKSSDPERKSILEP